MSYKEEFPDFELDVEIPEGFEDTSWHNNACPSWINDEGLTIWIDYPNIEDREGETETRFAVSWQNDFQMVNAVWLLNTNNWNEVLEAVKNFRFYAVNYKQVETVQVIIPTIDKHYDTARLMELSNMYTSEGLEKESLKYEKVFESAGRYISKYIAH